MKKLLKAIQRLILDAVDPVCQSRRATIYGYHRGYVVRLRPVERHGRVMKWVPDADEADRIDQHIQSAQVAPTPPTLPEFTPAGIPGL